MVGRALRTAAVGASVLAGVLAGAPAAAAGQDAAVAAELSGPGDGTCLAEIRDAWENPEPYVHDRVTEALPGVTPDSVADVFEHDRSVRVAVLPEPETAPGEIASRLYEQQDRRTVVLYSWHGDAFRVDTVTGGRTAGAEQPPVNGGDRIAPDDLLVHMEALGAVLRGEVTSTAAQALAERPLYVAPGLATDLTPQRADELAERFAALPGRVRVALLPSEAVEYEGAVVRQRAGNVADLVQGERDAPVVVYLVDGEGRVIAGAASDTAADSRFGLRGDTLSQVAGAARDGDSAAATLTNLLGRLAETPVGGGADERVADFLRYAAPFLVLVGVGLVLLIPVRHAEGNTWSGNETDGDSLPPSKDV